MNHHFGNVTRDDIRDHRFIERALHRDQYATSETCALQARGALVEKVVWIEVLDQNDVANSDVSRTHETSAYLRNPDRARHEREQTDAGKDREPVGPCCFD